MPSASRRPPDLGACLAPGLFAGGLSSLPSRTVPPGGALLGGATTGGLPPGGRFVAGFVDWFFVVGRACRDDPVVDFDISFS